MQKNPEKLHPPHPSLHADQRGFTLMLVLVAVVIIGLTAGIAGSSWQTIMQRAKEKELLFRGDQIRRGIASFYNVQHGGARQMLPSELDNLLKDPRFPGVKRHLRKLWKDPMTGKDWELIKDKTQGGRIKGVRSTSKLEPFKKDGFTEDYEKFADKESYSDWEFVFTPKRKNSRKGVVVPPATPPPSEKP